MSNFKKNVSSVIILVFFAILAFGSSDNKNDPSNNTSPKTQENISENTNSKNKIFKIGEVIQVGNFFYGVKQILFKKTLGNEYMQKTADGIFLIVQLYVKNISKESRTLDSSMFAIYDSNNAKYDYSIEGSTYLQMSNLNSIFLKQCQPNIDTFGYLIFEVPNNTDIYKLKVSGGFFSSKEGIIQLSE